MAPTGGVFDLEIESGCKLMRFLIFGLGAIGTYLGVSLIKGGQSVVFVERPDALPSLDSLQLRLELHGEHLSVDKPEIVSSLPAALEKGTVDVAFVAVKSFDTHNLALQMAEYRDSISAVVSLQNGVENESTLGAVLGSERIIAATLTSAVGRRGLGDVVLERKRGVGLASGHPRSVELYEVMQSAGLNPHLYASAGSMKWSKLLTNLLVNATSAILDMTPAEILAIPALYQIEVDQIREALAVMSALNYTVVDLPGTPVRAEAFIFKNLPPALSRFVARKAIVGGRGAKMPSFHIDLKNGRTQLEVNYLNGAVARIGEPLGCAIKVNSKLNLILSEIAAGKRSWQTYAHQPNKLVEEIYN